MRIGYARTSTIEQQAGFEAQVRDLETVGCEKVYREQVSSVGARERLEATLDYVREGDRLVVTKLDRLARSTRHLNEIVDGLKEKGAHGRRGIGLILPTVLGGAVLGLAVFDSVIFFLRA